QAQWIDAANLKAGYKLLTDSGSWQRVSNVAIKSEKLTAYNLTVDKFHTYFVKAKEAESGVWVHNDCWDQLPFDAVATGKSTPDGRKLYTFKDGKGNRVTAYQGSDGRYYNPKVHSPESPTKINTKAVDSFPNRNGLRATKGHVYYTTPEATEAARKLGFEKTNQTLKGEAIYKDNKGRYITIDVGNGRNQGGAHNGGVWKMADSIKNLGKKETRMGTYDANLNRIGD
ncbi:toxin C-terminal domain-containing protein, partial [Ursidibacter sp. B-7004-1]